MRMLHFILKSELRRKCFLLKNKVKKNIILNAKTRLFNIQNGFCTYKKEHFGRHKNRDLRENMIL